MSNLPILVVDFDGLLNPMPEGWFDLGAHKTEPARGAISFLIRATEFFDVQIFGPRSLMFGGIQTMQAAIIYWTTCDVNKQTMHDLMAILRFPAQMPTDYAMAINSSGSTFGPTEAELTQEARKFALDWQATLAADAGRR